MRLADRKSQETSQSQIITIEIPGEILMDHVEVKLIKVEKIIVSEMAMIDLEGMIIMIMMLIDDRETMIGIMTAGTRETMKEKEMITIIEETIMTIMIMIDLIIREGMIHMMIIE